MRIKIVYKILFALFGILLIGVGIAFNASALLGNDPIAILYDGVRNAANLGMDKLGLVTNIINFSVIVILLFIGRKHLNIGTIIYMVPLGYFVDAGNQLYQRLFRSPTIMLRLLGGLFGSGMIYIGVGIFIAVNIGLDPFTALVMVIGERTKMTFRKTKIIFDICLVTIGFFLGGTLGIVTIITALTAGPSIQWVSEQIRANLRWLN